MNSPKKMRIFVAGLLSMICFLGAGYRMVHAAPADDFVITISTDSGLFTIPTNPSYNTYGYQVDWNNDLDLDDPDESTLHTGNAAATYDYGGPGTYTIRIVGNFPAIYFNSSSEAAKLVSVDQWGTGEWVTMELAFAGCVNLTSVSGVDNPDLAAVTDMSGMFQDATSFNGDISGWNTGSVVDMSYMFSGAAAFNQNIGAWDTSFVVNMSSMFSNATSFNQNIGVWNTSSVTDMSSMFSNATSFDQDISGWYTSSVTSMNAMFSDATSFNQAINTDTLNSFWVTTAVTDMGNMFQDATSFNGDIVGWDTGSVTDMSCMFDRASSFD